MHLKCTTLPQIEDYFVKLYWNVLITMEWRFEVAEKENTQAAVIKISISLNEMKLYTRLIQVSSRGLKPRTGQYVS